eukprot:GHRR01012688.1.p1 GENE.GHRR01012688.1~~GHRR01012688.1.p1  ORF type:complete len:194 (+),score=70.90 GHRR01012688.1:157-738(+)
MVATDVPLLQGLAQGFAALDLTKRGCIPYSQVAALLQSGKYDLSGVEVCMLMSQFDLDSNGWVDYYEWLAALLDWSQIQSDSKWEAWLRQVFNKFDADSNGQISLSELESVLESTEAASRSELEEENPCMLKDTVPAALREADSMGDGQLCFAEFVALLQTNVADQLDLFPSRRHHKTQALVKERFARHTQAC